MKLQIHEQVPKITEIISSADSEWLSQLAGEDSLQADVNWIDQMNELANLGSRYIDDLPFDRRYDVYMARQNFFKRLPEIDDKSLEQFHNPSNLPKPDTFVDSMRFLHQNDINIIRVCNHAPTAMGFSKQNLYNKLEVFERAGIQSQTVVNKLPLVIEYAAESVISKLDTLSAIGINPAVINSSPNILMMSPETIIKKNEFYSSKDLGFARIVAKNSRLATYSTKTVNRRLNVLYSIAKQGGKEEYRNYVNSVVEQWPAILTYQPARLRVLARIAFNSLDYDSMEELTLSNITNIVIPNLEATLAGYLENKADIQAPSDLHNLSKKYKHFGNQALKSIIKQYSEDPAAKVYLRNFKIN